MINEKILFWAGTTWEKIKASDDLHNKLMEDYVEELKKRPCCEEGTGSLREFHSEVINLYINNKNSLTTTKMQAEKKYQMKACNVYCTSLHDYIGPANMNDERAEKLLNEQPEMYVYFDVIPEKHKAKIMKALAANTATADALAAEAAAELAATEATKKLAEAKAEAEAAEAARAGAAAEAAAAIQNKKTDAELEEEKKIAEEIAAEDALIEAEKIAAREKAEAAEEAVANTKKGK